MKLREHYPHVGFLFVLFFGLAIYGFFRSYFSLFPRFPEHITLLTHVHSLSIVTWMIILILQPVLIRFKQHKLHRLIGQCSYIFVSFLGLIMVLTIRQGYLKGVGKIPEADLLGFQFVPVSAFLCFCWTYTMAMLNRSNRPVHKSYMIVHALGLLWAAFGRLDYRWLGIHTFQQAIAVSYLPSALILLLILIAERISQKKTNNVYLLSMIIFLATPLFFYFGTQGSLWQGIAKLIFTSG